MQKGVLTKLWFQGLSDKLKQHLSQVDVTEHMYLLDCEIDDPR